ncbi:SGNH/GDSL hydrolase family protein [Undibacterium sp.]|jgi:lysophospholipase L1-like esterase|uniref:SGNH/GDSL hydrolase family protein n=1 Tax=Undibacterium sp. TaxID=1914977 RepID=UPI002B756F6B|nr:SGNH/GDSL hydrolase family protein [Undibacterium sp.]HTD03129.1 SGNH/GDSL hydrolase family protein [Undibacterium sp.]
MRAYLPELLALPLFPLLYLQGKHVRRVTPRLPEAGGPASGVAAPPGPSAGPPLRLLGIGESPVAGVGVASHEQAITAQLAAALAQQSQSPVSWQAIGLNGADLAQALTMLVPQLPAGACGMDIVLIAFGVNDTTAFRSANRYRAELAQLIGAVQERLAPAHIILSGVPPMHAFPALPQPLRFVLGSKAKVLDRVSEELAGSFANVHYVAMQLDASEPGLMAADGYHPSAKGARSWAGHLAEAMRLSFVQPVPKI